jgi:hypothetical protein
VASDATLEGLTDVLSGDKVFKSDPLARPPHNLNHIISEVSTQLQNGFKSVTADNTSWEIVNICENKNVQKSYIPKPKKRPTASFFCSIFKLSRSEYKNLQVSL